MSCSLAKFLLTSPPLRGTLDNMILSNADPHAADLLQLVVSAAQVSADRAALDDRRNGVCDSYAPLDFVEREVSRAAWSLGADWADLDVEAKVELSMAYSDAYRFAYEETADAG